MFFSNITIAGFRNFLSTELIFDKRYNFFCGSNGSGKTTILETLYYLILGRSFRSHLLRRIISYGEKEFTLFGVVEEDNCRLSIGVTRSMEKGKQYKISGKVAHSNGEIIGLMPLQLLNHDSYLLLYQGSKIRRQFMDWGLFHVEQSFLTLWRKVEHILKQRNAALREHARRDYIKMWDEEFAANSLELHRMREQYVGTLLPIVANILQGLFPIAKSIELTYYPGWNLDKSLVDVLAETLSQDLKFGYTTMGPQRADLHIKIHGMPVREILSRGQQKIVVYVLQVAQGILLHRSNGKAPVYLVDDLLAELDFHSASLVANLLQEMKSSQIFFTALALENIKMLFSQELSKGRLFLVDSNGVNCEKMS